MKSLRGAAEANPELPRFTRNRLRNLVFGDCRVYLEIATLSFGKLAMTKKRKVLGKLNYYGKEQTEDGKKI
ncbi:hypothetical protein J7M02_04545 [Candidatus Aerophobetes bacterium]|nr:hypothetical protein [Candidatus Aerophobetes bacterium]